MSDLIAQASNPPARRRPLLMRGESFVAVFGIATAAIVVTVALAMGMVAFGDAHQSTDDARRRELNTTASILSHASESLLAANDVSSLRRLIIDTARSANLQACRLTMPDGRILADADPSKINVASLAAHWPSGPLDAIVPTSDENRIIVSTPIHIGGRGTVMLFMASGVAAAPRFEAPLVTGLALAGAAGLGALLLAYRHARQRALVIGLIGESLLAREAGETSIDVLAISTTLGPEAIAWNQLLADAHNKKSDSPVDRTHGVHNRRREGSSDLEQACDSLAVGMMLVEPSGRVKLVNGAAATLLQLKRDGLVGSEFAAIVSEPAICKAVAAVGSGVGRRETIEWNREEQGGDGVLRVHVRPLRREDGSGSLVTLEDVTQHRVAEAARHSFVAQTTHELRAPLTNMRLCLESVIDEGQSDPVRMVEAFNVINREARRLERMVSEMLSVAEIEAGSMQLSNDDVKLDRVFAELETDFKPFAADKKITLKFEMPPKLPEFFADRDRLTLAIHNLVGNAVKYTPAGGAVTVTLHDDGKKLSVDVADTGIGISEAELAPIFDRFYRAKDPRVAKITGSGLGLALSREVARLHGGDVTVQSELNKGSTFTLSVPLKAPPARTTAKAA